MKNFNLKFSILLIVGIMFGSFYAQSQTYYLPNPEGFGAGTTGGGAPTSSNTVTVTTSSQLLSALTGSKSVVLVSGTITTSRLEAVITNKSIIGLPGARLVNLNQTASGSGILHIKPGSNNVIIRNLTFEGPGAYDVDGWDLITNKGCYKLWVDHCDFQDGVDCLFDNTNNSDNITVSWCKFSFKKPAKPDGPGGSDDHRYANLIGGGESDYPTDGRYSITWQNCWWADGVRARMVRARNGEIHMINCYWNSQASNYNISLTSGDKGTTCYVESGVFNCTGAISDLGSGCSIKFDNCSGGSSNVGTVSKPSYSISEMATSAVVSAVTNSSCGAGATLRVTSSGVISTSCGSVTTYTLTASVSGGNGSVTPTSGTYNSGTTVTLTATPNSGYVVNTWTGVTSSNGNTATVTMNSNKTVTVSFSPATTTYTLTASVSGGNGTVTPTSGTYASGSTVTLTATPNSGYVVNTWTGVTSSNGNTATVTMNNNKTVTVSFIQSSVPPVAGIYEAENATLIYAGVESTYAGYSGTGYVNTSNKAGSGVEWSVPVTSAGTYYIYFRYANKSTNMPGNVSINSTVVGSVALSNTGGLTSYGNSSIVTVNLVSGTNKIKLLSSTSVGLPNMDYLYVSSSALKSVGKQDKLVSDNLTSPFKISPSIFKTTTNMSFEIQEASNVSIMVFNLKGGKVAEVTNQNYSAGCHTLVFERNSMATGTYIVKMVTNGKVQTAKMILYR